MDITDKIYDIFNNNYCAHVYEFIKSMWKDAEYYTIHVEDYICVLNNIIKYNEVIQLETNTANDLKKVLDELLQLEEA